MDIQKAAEEYVMTQAKVITLPNREDDCEELDKAFQAGANTVLTEVLALLPSEDNRLNDYGKALLWRLNEKIKELKGE